MEDWRLVGCLPREACEIGWEGIDRLIENIPESEIRECRREGIQSLLRRRTLVLGGGEKVHLLVEVVGTWVALDCQAGRPQGGEGYH